MLTLVLVLLLIGAGLGIGGLFFYAMAVNAYDIRIAAKKRAIQAEQRAQEAAIVQTTQDAVQRMLNVARNGGQ